MACLSRKKWTTWDNFGSNQLQPWIFRIRLRHLIKLGRSPTKWSKRWKVGETSLVASKWKHLHGDWMGKRTNGQSNSWRVASCQQSNMSGSTNFCKRRHNLNLSHLRRWDNKQAPQMPHFLNLTLYFSATTRTASRMRTTLRTTTQTGTGEGARLPPVGVPVPIWTPTIRTPHSPRLFSLGTIIPSVSDEMSFVHLASLIYLLPFTNNQPNPTKHLNPIFSFEDPIEITVALLADPAFCKWTRNKACLLLGCSPCLPRNRRSGSF